MGILAQARRKRYAHALRHVRREPIPQPADVLAQRGVRGVCQLRILIEDARCLAPGFINFRLSSDWLAAQVDVILAAGPEFGGERLSGPRAPGNFLPRPRV